jgi:hypothetical protein
MDRSLCALCAFAAATAAAPVERPKYNTGAGFFVSHGKLFDANGEEFIFRGVDRCHYDSDSSAGMARAGPNAVRLFVDTNYGANWSHLMSLVQTQHIENRQVPIVTLPATATGNATSCNQDPAILAEVVERSWLPNAALWKPLEKYTIMNLANEWGPGNSTVWRDSYIDAIAKMRAAGFLGALLIDPGGCGQDLDGLVSYAAEIFDSDPQKNIIFALHPYGSVNDFSATIVNITRGKQRTVLTLGSRGSSPSVCHPFAPHYCPALNLTNTYSGLHAYNISGATGMVQINGRQPAPQNVGGSPGAWTVTLSTDSSSFGEYTGGGTIVDYDGNPMIRIGRLAALRESTGAAFAVTEFGPGRNIGPSPTLATPLEIVSAAEEHGLGWLAWAWDDNDMAQSETNNEGFGMTYHSGEYTGSSSNLTMFGQQIVLGCVNPHPGGCGCPDGVPLPPYFDPDNPKAPPPEIYSKVEPGCTGTPTPKYQPLSLKLAVPATVFGKSKSASPIAMSM